MMHGQKNIKLVNDVISKPHCMTQDDRIVSNNVGSMHREK